MLVIVVPNDRKMRIEVGYGLEGTLTDVASSRIIRDRMTPQFKEGNYDRGVSDGVDAIIAQLEGRAESAPDERGGGELERRQVAGADRRAGARRGRCASCSAHSSSASSGSSPSSA